MRNCFVFTLSDKDSYRIANSATVNINDSSFFCYTFWKPRIGGKKQTYITPYRFSNEALDLLYISLMIFYVDRKVKRKDQNDAWTRYFELYMPVKDEVKWEGCKKILTDALNFLTGDHWILHFRSWTSLTDEEAITIQGVWNIDWTTEDDKFLIDKNLLKTSRAFIP